MFTQELSCDEATEAADTSHTRLQPLKNVGTHSGKALTSAIVAAKRVVGTCRLTGGVAGAGQLRDE